MKRRYDWPQLIKLWQASGLSQAAFCREQGLCPKHFSVRKRALLKSTSGFIQVQRAQPEPRAVTAHPTSVAIATTLYYGDQVRLSLPSGVSPEYVAQLIKQLT